MGPGIQTPAKSVTSTPHHWAVSPGPSLKLEKKKPNKQKFMVILLKVSCLPLPFAFLLVLFGEKVETRPYFVSELSSHSLQSSCFKVLSTEDKRYGLPCLTFVVFEVYILFFILNLCVWIFCLYGYHVPAWCMQRLEKGGRSLDTGGSCHVGTTGDWTSVL